MSKHTPGPWLSRGKSDSVHESSDTHPYGCQIFRFADDQGPSDDDLNLILSAPDLLEALESTTECAEILRGLIESIEKHGNYSAESTINFLNQALGCHYLSTAAIARARGEAVSAKESTTPANDCWYCDGTKEYQGQPCLICVEPTT